MAIDINIPSQVKTYANLAAFPATGSLKTIFIAEDTNKTYRWTGTAYVEVSAAGASGITIGTTAITSGTVGRVLFQGTGNVVSQSANLFFDVTNSYLGLGGTPARRLDVISDGTNWISGVFAGSGGTPKVVVGNLSGFATIGGHNATLTAWAALAINSGGGNVLIGTTTDAGFKLDVNGTARVVTSSGSYTAPLTVENTGSASDAFKNVAFFAGNRGNASSIDDNTNIGIQQKSNIINNFATLNFFNAGGNLSAYIGAQFLSHSGGQNGNLVFGTTTNGTPSTKMTIFSTGNVSINTTTDSGYKLDVNGTARIATSLTVTTGKAFSGYNSGGTASDALKLELTGNGAVLGIQNSNASGFSGVEYLNNAGAPRVFTGFNNSNGQEFRFNNFATGGYIDFLIGGTSSFRVFNSRNVGIGTTTDAGFKLDVNGTARFGNVFQATNANSITAGYEGGFVLSGGVGSLKRDTTGYLKTLLDCGYDGGLRIRPYSVGFTSYVDVRSDTSAALTVTSTNQGFLPPRLTTTQKNAIASPAAGLMVYDTTLNLISVYNGTIWITL